jgi:hypothetical protein
MNAVPVENCPGRKIRKISAFVFAGTLAGVLAMAPVAGAGNSRVESRVVDDRVIDHAPVESLQRWVSSGHADWCRDARLVAAEVLWRLAPDFSGDGFELNEAIEGITSKDANRITYEWVQPDGRAVYRVTVERFDWLLSIAKDLKAIVWVPTSTEIRVHE